VVVVGDTMLKTANELTSVVDGQEAANVIQAATVIVMTIKNVVSDLLIIIGVVTPIVIIIDN
jgi:hypothetical protein